MALYTRRENLEYFRKLGIPLASERPYDTPEFKLTVIKGGKPGGKKTGPAKRPLAPYPAPALVPLRVKDLLLAFFAGAALLAVALLGWTVVIFLLK